jgi:hypothetical protein
VPDETEHDYAAVVGIVPLGSVGAANVGYTSFRGDPLVQQYWKQLFGDDVTNNKETAMQLSPLYQLQHLKANILLIHAEQDPRVPREHADAIASKVKAMGLTGAHLTYDREGHSIRREPNVIHMWSSIERFLCSSLSLPEPPPFNATLTEGHTCTVHWNNFGTLFPSVAVTGKVRRCARICWHLCCSTTHTHTLMRSFHLDSS